MIFELIDEEQLTSILKVDSIEAYPQISGLLAPAAESIIANAVGAAWVEAHTGEPELALLLCTMIASWIDNPEMFGQVTPGCNFMISQLQAKALEVDP